MKTENDGRNDFDFLIGTWKVHHRTVETAAEWVNGVGSSSKVTRLTEKF